MGRGNLVDCVVFPESTVRRMSERRRVMTKEGKLCESRFDGERGSVEGI